MNDDRPQPESPPVVSPQRVPVAVLIERRMVQSGRWRVPSFEVTSISCGDRAPAQAAIVEQPADGDLRRFLISGLSLELFADACESYWYNLQSEVPRLFVVCFTDDDADADAANALGLTPALVTASQDEAGAHMESDDPVFSVPMPPLVIDWAERFVVAHYQPEHRKKRKRRNWADESMRGNVVRGEPGGDAREPHRR